MLNTKSLISNLLFVAVGIVVCSHSALLAQTTVYTNRTDFDNATILSTLFDFEDQDVGATGQMNLGNSAVFGDATISVPGGGVWATNLFGAPTIQISALNNTAPTITLNPGFTALGMDLGGANGNSAFDLLLSNLSGGVLENLTVNVGDNDLLGTASTSFIGFVSDSDDIHSLLISAGDFATLDNLVIGTALAVPEPSSLAILFAVGMATLTRRRR